MASQNSLVLLNRLLSSKESSPFLLVLDSLSQSSHYLIEEFGHKTSTPIVYLSFKTINRPKFTDEFHDCTSLPLKKISEIVKQTTTKSAQKSLVIIDSLNYISTEELTTFITSLILPNVTLLGTFHTDVPISYEINYPLSINLLSYVASSIFELEPAQFDEEKIEEKLSKFQIPINNNLNSPVFKLTLTNRRKSGRSLKYEYIVDTASHNYEVCKKEEAKNEEDESMLKDLSTFNLTTNNKQKLAREQVELPFMEAQQALGSSGGAIVYEFEKDDDYDEEDPYEDPF